MNGSLRTGPSNHERAYDTTARGKEVRQETTWLIHKATAEQHHDKKSEVSFRSIGVIDFQEPGLRSYRASFSAKTLRKIFPAPLLGSSLQNSIICGRL